MTRHESFCIILRFFTKKEIKMKIGLIGAVAVAAVVVAGCGKKVSPATAGEQGKAADMDGNRMVDAKDLTWLKRYLLSR